jgi:GT2 family glycosyltransferase
MTAQMFDLTIVIPNYNTKDLLRDCISTIYEHTKGISFEIICIDDNSPDGSAEMVAETFPDVILIRNKVNQLYAKNNNMGMRMSRARYACLLNSDTKLISNAFEALVHFMDEHGDIAACGPKLLNPDLTVQHCIRRFVRPGSLVLQALNWHKLFPKSKSMTNLYATDFDYSKMQQVDSIGTTAYVVRRSTWEQAGMLDERFQLFVVDWAYNFMLRQKGYKVYYTPCAELVHFGSQSVNQKARKSIGDLHHALILFSNTYNYFGSGRTIKCVVRLAVLARCYLKLAEYYLGSDKRVIKGPGAPPSTRASLPRGL